MGKRGAGGMMMIKRWIEEEEEAAGGKDGDQATSSSCFGQISDELEAHAHRHSRSKKGHEEREDDSRPGEESGRALLVALHLSPPSPFLLRLIHARLCE